MLFCITANFTPKALNAIRQNPKSNQRDSVEQLVKAAGGKLVAMYGTMTEGPGALAIIDVDPISAAAITPRASDACRVEHNDDPPPIAGLDVRL